MRTVRNLAPCPASNTPGTRPISAPHNVLMGSRTGLTPSFVSRGTRRNDTAHVRGGLFRGKGATRGPRSHCQRAGPVCLPDSQRDVWRNEQKHRSGANVEASGSTNFAPAASMAVRSETHQALSWPSEGRTEGIRTVMRVKTSTKTKLEKHMFIRLLGTELLVPAFAALVEGVLQFPEGKEAMIGRSSTSR